MRLMSRRAAAIVLTSEEQSTLDAWARGRTIAVRLVQRAQIIRMASQGILSQDIAEELGRVSPDCAAVAATILGSWTGRVGEGCTSTRACASHQPGKSSRGC